MNALGIDTSNYTTSAARYDGAAVAANRKLPLPVSPGQRGLRQSDAVFHHTRQLPVLLAELLPDPDLAVLGVSDRPRQTEDSYMPCFLTGLGHAQALGAALGLPVLRFSHQQGHIAAALYSAGRLDLLERDFLAFHVSGGLPRRTGRTQNSACGRVFGPKGRTGRGPGGADAGASLPLRTGAGTAGLVLAPASAGQARHEGRGLLPFRH